MNRAFVTCMPSGPIATSFAVPTKVKVSRDRLAAARTLNGVGVDDPGSRALMSASTCSRISVGVQPVSSAAHWLVTRALRALTCTVGPKVMPSSVPSTLTKRSVLSGCASPRGLRSMDAWRDFSVSP